MRIWEPGFVTDIKTEKGRVEVWVLSDTLHGGFYRSPSGSVYFDKETVMKASEGAFRLRKVEDLKADDVIKLSGLVFIVAQLERRGQDIRFTLKRKGEPRPRTSFLRAGQKVLVYDEGAVHVDERGAIRGAVADKATAAGTTTKEDTTMAKDTTKDQPSVALSERIFKAIGSPEIKGLTVEMKARGRGTSAQCTGSATAMKKLQKELSAYADDRKGKTGQEYEDRYQAGVLVKKIDALLSAGE